MIYTASELIAAGASSGSIQSIAFNVKTTKGIALNDFTIKIGATTESVATSTFLTGLTEVYTTTSYTEVAGWNTHVLTTPFAWDGVSNIVVETSLQNSSTSSNVNSYRTATADNSCTYYRGTSASTASSGSTSKNRPNIQIGINMVPETNDLAIISWEAPISPVLPNIANPVSIKFYNSGVEMVDTFDISYSIDGGATYIVETYNDSLSAGDTLTYTFTATASFPAGSHSCFAAVHNVGDTITDNDSLAYTINSGSPLNGTYTVGSATTDDYATIHDITSYLEIFGVTGPVVINLAAETFDEQVSITGPITGMSATNNLTINGHGASTIISSANTSSSDRDIFRINGQSYITLDSISILSTGTSDYNAGIRIMESIYITVKNCNITVPELTTANTNGILVSGSMTSSSTSTTTNNLTFENNTITNGYYGIRNYGNSSNHSTNLIVKNNTINNFYNYGIYSYYQDSVIITNNTFVGSVNSSIDYGIYLYRNYLGSVIANNNVTSNSTGSGYGMYVYYCEGSAANPFLIYNNMVAATQATGSFNGIYSAYGKNVSFYHNTVSLNSGDADSRALYVAGSTTSSNIENVQFMNNIFSNMGSGYAVCFNSTYYPTKVTAMDYNNLFAPNAANIAYMGSDYADLASWKAAAYGLDSNSANLNPSFTSASDLHCASIAMKSLGFPIAGITTDIDGDTRNLTTPDMGADEYTPLSNDVAILEIISPMGNTIPLGLKTPIKIRVKNFGINTQTSLPMVWSQDGGITMNYETITITLNSLDSDTITLSDSLFFNKLGINEVSIALGLTNDDNRNNDTIKSTILSGSPFNGTYTIGASGADLESFTFTITMLNLLGVDGPVIFNVNAGVYNEQFEINEIAGVSSTNTIIFQSATGNNADVMLEYNNATSSDNYIVWLNGADNITFKNLSFSTANSSDYGRIFYFKSNADSNTVMNCNLTTKYVDDDDFAAIYSYDDVNNANIIDGNTFKDCYAAVDWEAVDDNSGDMAIHNVFKNNTISNYKEYGMYLKYHDGVQVIGNTITGSASYGLSLEYCENDMKISKNTITNTGETGLRIYRGYASSSNKSEISNNMISGASEYGIYDYRGKYRNYYNNTVNVNNSEYAFYFYNSSATTYIGHAIYNNIFVNEGSGYAAYIEKSDLSDSLDYNNYYSPNGKFVHFGSDYSDLAALKAGESNFNQHSYEIDPVFVSSTDLHILSGPMANLGLPIDTITEDIDGNTRSLTTPDIGADEYVFQSHNVLVNNIYGPSQMYCGSMTDSIWIDVRNLGDVVQDTIPVKAIITTPTGIVNVTDTLFANVAGASIYNGFFLTTVNTTTPGIYSVKAYTDLANDGDRSTDTMMVDFETSSFVAGFPYAEDFSTWPPANWDMTGGAFDWINNNNRAMANFTNDDTLDCIMMTPPIDLGISTLPLVKFTYKYNYVDLTNDSLAVQIKTCGNAWFTLWAKGSERLSTIDPITSNVNYVDIELEIPSTYLGQEVFVRFNGISDGGANIYITNVLVADYPAVNLPVDTATCAGDSIILNAGAGMNYSYNWRTKSDPTTIATTQMLTVLTPDTFIVTVTDNNSGLSTNDTVVFKTNPVPVASIASFATPIYNFSTTLSGSATGGIGTYTYEWSPAAMIDGSETTQNVNTIGITAYQYFTLTVVDSMQATACQDTAMVYVKYTGGPILVAPSASNDTVCKGLSSTVYANSTHGGANHSWSWTSNPAGFISSLETPVVTPTQNTWYIVEVTDGSNTAIDSVQVVTWDLPTVTTSSDQSMCIGDSVQISLNFMGEQPYSFNVFDGSNTFMASSNTSLFTAYTNPTTTTNYVITSITDNNGCISTGNIDSIEVTVNALPVVTLTSLADVCADASNFSITGASPAGGTWSGNGVSGNSFNAVNAGAGSHYLTYTFTNANGCINSDSTTQLVNALPMLNVSGLDVDYCADALVDTLTATPAGGSFTGSGMTANIFDPSMANIGAVSIVYTYTDATTGCSNSSSVSTMINALPVVNLGADYTVCENSSSMLDAGNAGASYLWSNGATTQTIGLDTTGVGAFMYNVLVTDANMCTNTDTIEITYATIPVSQLIDTNTICGEDAQITLDAGHVTGNSYLWSNGASGSSITINALDLGGTTGNMSVKITNTDGCEYNDTTYVYFREVPVVDLGGDDTVCINHEFTLDAGAGFTSYLWNTGATTQAITIDSNTFTIGNNMFMVEVYNNLNCSAKDSMILVVDICTGVQMPELANAEITIYPNPTKGQFQIDVVGLENEAYDLDIYNTVGALVYSDKVSNAGNSKQTHKLDFSAYSKGVYYVRLHSNGSIKVKRIVIQ